MEEPPPLPPSWATETFGLSNTALTAITIAALVLLRFFVVLWLRNPGHRWKVETRRRWIAHFKIVHLAVTLLVLAYIWSEEVYAFGVSIFAIGLAIVIALKELLVCLHGSLLRLRGHAYDVGDRIEVNGIRGDVININLLSTTVMEVGPGELTQQQTGRSICIPNALFLTHPVINESFLQNYLLHNITIPLRRSDDWRRAKELLLSIAEDECAPYLEKARRRIRELERKHTADLPSVEPRITMHLHSPDEMHMVLRVPTPAPQKGRMERNILERFLEAFTERPHPHGVAVSLRAASSDPV